MPVASEKPGGDFKLCPAGMHQARCIQIIDLGTQHDSFEGKPKIIHKVRIGWELPNEKAIFDEERGEEPFIVSAEYTLSLGSKANLRHDLESWRGKAFTAEELKGFDLKVLIGKACLLNVIHQPSKADPKKIYARVSAVTPVPKGTHVPKATLPKLVYEITDGTGGCFGDLPEWIQNKIKLSDEFRGDAHQPSEERPPDGADEDDIPF